jgi:hypothetical protein
MLLAFFIRKNFITPFLRTFEFDDCQTVFHNKVYIIGNKLVSIVAHAIEIITIIFAILPQFITISAKQHFTYTALNWVLNNTTTICAAQEPADR